MIIIVEDILSRATAEKYLYTFMVSVKLIHVYLHFAITSGFITIDHINILMFFPILGVY